MRRHTAATDPHIRAVRVTRDRIGRGARFEIADATKPQKIERITYKNVVLALSAGFRRRLFSVELGADSTVTALYALIDIYHMPPRYIIDDTGATLIGTVEFKGTVQGAGVPGDTPRWQTRIVVTCPFHPGNAEDLPPEVRSVGPGAYITGVVQALFGTKSGLAMLGLSEDQVPDIETDWTCTMVQVMTH